jgi:hypothetical protein
MMAPCATSLVMRRRRHVHVELFRFRDWCGWPRDPEDAFERIGVADLRWRTFRGAVLSVLQRLWREHGAEGYVALWQGAPFPLEELRALERD